MKRIDVESLRDAIKSGFNLESYDYDELEQNLMLELEFDYITVDEFEDKLIKCYKELEKLQSEE